MINGQYSLGQKYRGRIGQVQMTLYSWWKKKTASPILKTDDFVKHVCREHNQEADHWANIGAHGQRKTVLGRRETSESWRAVTGYCDGSFKDNGKRGCGGDQRGRQGKMGDDQ